MGMRSPNPCGNPVVSHTPGFHLVLLGLWLLAACAGKPSALTALRDVGTLRVAVDPAYPPFESIDAAGNLVGFDIDLAHEIARRLGVEVHFVVTGYDALYDALTVGRADVIISALYPDPSRTAGFAFSQAYFNAGDVLVAPATSPIAAIPDLSGKQLMIVFGTEAHMNALEWEKSLHPPPVLLTGDAAETIIAAMAAGYADAAIVDGVAAHAALARMSDVRVVGAPITQEPYVVAAAAKNQEIIEAITEILQTLEQDGTLQTLIERWMH